MTRQFGRILGVAALALTVWVAGAVVRAQDHSRAPADFGPQRFTAIAANLGALGPRHLAERVDIRVNRWTTDAQRDELLAALRAGGEQALLSALQKQPVVGTIQTPEALGYDLHYARKEPWGDGGEKVVLGTDRYVSFREVANQSRTLDYPFSLIELTVDHAGDGQGKISIATKVVVAGNTLVLENWAPQPVLLTALRREE